MEQMRYFGCQKCGWHGAVAAQASDSRGMIYARAYDKHRKESIVCSNAYGTELRIRTLQQNIIDSSKGGITFGIRQ